MEKAKEVLLEIARAIVDNPAAVSAEVKRDDMGVLISLYVAKEDIGKIIGREGKTAGAIRTILRVIGMKEKARINLRIPEPEGGRQDHRDRDSLNL